MQAAPPGRSDATNKEGTTLPDNHRPLPDRDGTHVTSTVRLSGNPKVTYYGTGEGLIASDFECTHGYVGLVATEEWYDEFYAGVKTFIKARKAAS